MNVGFLIFLIVIVFKFFQLKIKIIFEITFLMSINFHKKVKNVCNVITYYVNIVPKQIDTQCEFKVFKNIVLLIVINKYI